MGWWFHNEPLRHETPAAYFGRELTHESETHQATVLATATVRGTVYAAIRNHDKQTGASYVFCAVILFKNSKRDGFGYKSMDEGMGPCEVDCPDRIFRLLSPVENIPNPGTSADWRARVIIAKVQAAASRTTLAKLVPGAIVPLPCAAHFGKHGISADAFRVIEVRKRTPILAPLAHPTFRCRLGRATLAIATISRD